ncbi:MAG: phosphatidylglycerophosphatase A, partial [Pseudomonadota bacterium]
MMIARAISQVFGVGLIKPAPGTWGSLVALPLAYLLHLAGGPVLLVVAIICAFILGLWATATTTRGLEDHDPSEIVIDEVVGQWIALLPVSLGA